MEPVNEEDKRQKPDQVETRRIIKQELSGFFCLFVFNVNIAASLSYRLLQCSQL